LAPLSPCYTFFVLSPKADPIWASTKIPLKLFLNPHLLIYRLSARESSIRYFIIKECGLTFAKFNPTIEDSYKINLTVNGQQGTLKILNTAGANEYKHLRGNKIDIAKQSMSLLEG
jgi:hypothetical protein